MNRRAAAALAAVTLSFLAAPAASSAAPATGHAHARGSSVTRTAVSRVRPVTAGGHLKPHYKVVKRLGGAQCSFGSEATGTAYRCFAHNFVIDPCWVTAQQQHVDCMLRPWSHKVWRLHVSKGYDNSGFSSGPAHRGATPWGVRRASGQRCEWAQGASGVVGNRRINYFCNGSSVVLTGRVDRSNAVWRIHKAVRSGTGYAPAGRTKLRHAWYGKPTREG